MKNILFTPGPLNCHEEIHSAMQGDIGSRDPLFIEKVRSIRRRLLKVAGLGQDCGYTAVPMQGSGTFGLESAITTIIGRKDKLLVLENGTYGVRIGEIARRSGREVVMYSVPPTQIHDPLVVGRMLSTDPSISHVAVVHCETTTGILNPLSDIANGVKNAARTLIVDAMSSFGGIPIDFKELNIDCLISSANKCLESVPGFSFVIVKKSILKESKGNCSSVSLDLYDQWIGLETNGQFRFTPPTHSLLAFDRALELFFEDGGVPGRSRRYLDNHEILVNRMKEIGFDPVIDISLQSPIITAFPFPDIPDFDFEDFYTRLSAKGLTIYPGKLTGLDCFRIGTIGQIVPEDVERLVNEIGNLM